MSRSLEQVCSNVSRALQLDLVLVAAARRAALALRLRAVLRLALRKCVRAARAHLAWETTSDANATSVQVSRGDRTVSAQQHHEREHCFVGVALLRRS